MGRSSSSTVQRTDNTQQISTENVNLSDFEGIGVADARDVQITVTDQEAIRAGTEIALAGLDANEGVVDRSLDFAESSLDFGQGVAANAVATLGGAISKVANATRSDASQTINTLVKAGAVVAVIGLIAFMISRG